MNQAEIYEGLTEIFRDLFSDDNIVLTPDTTADQIEGWDSFNHLNILVAAEIRFGVKLKSNKIEKLINVGDLVKAIQESAESP